MIIFIIKILKKYNEFSYIYFFKNNFYMFDNYKLNYNLFLQRNGNIFILL